MDIQIEPVKSSKELPMNLLLEGDESLEMINDYTSSGQSFIAKSENRVIGVIVVLRTRPKTLEIMNVAVEEEFRNKGIGRKLIQFVIEYAKNNNYKTMEIGTGNCGVVQLALYQKCGFRIVGIEFDFFQKYCNKTFMENGIECRDMIRLRMEL